MLKSYQWRYIQRHRYNITQYQINALGNRYYQVICISRDLI